MFKIKEYVIQLHPGSDFKSPTCLNIFFGGMASRLPKLPTLFHQIKRHENYMESLT